MSKEREQKEDSKSTGERELRKKEHRQSEESRHGDKEQARRE